MKESMKESNLVCAIDNDDAMRKHKISIITTIHKAEQLLGKSITNFYTLYDCSIPYLQDYDSMLGMECVRAMRAERKFGITRKW